MPGKLYIGLKRELVLNTWKLIIIYKYFSSVRFLTNMVIHEPSALLFLFPLLQLPPAPKLFLFVTPEQKPFERQLLAACLHAVVRVREDGRQIALTVPVCLNWVQMTSNPGAKVWERYHKSYEDLCHLRSKYFITSVLNKDVFCIHTRFDEEAPEYPQQKLLSEKGHAAGLGVWRVWLIPITHLWAEGSHS